jgi:hypothetical protein
MKTNLKKFYVESGGEEGKRNMDKGMSNNADKMRMGGAKGEIQIIARECIYRGVQKNVPTL